MKKLLRNTLVGIVLSGMATTGIGCASMEEAEFNSFIWGLSGPRGAAAGKILEMDTASRLGQQKGQEKNEERKINYPVSYPAISLDAAEYISHNGPPRSMIKTSDEIIYIWGEGGIQETYTTPIIEGEKLRTVIFWSDTHTEIK